MVHDGTGQTGRPGGPDTIDGRILAALGDLLRALDLQTVGEDRFRVISAPARFNRIFGGQLVAQALIAACATVERTSPHSLHAQFVEVGDPEQPLDLIVDRIRDGRSMSTRRVTVAQRDKTVLILMASFDKHVSGLEPSEPPRAVHPAETLPTLHDWIHRLPPEQRGRAERWLERPPPVLFRMEEPPTLITGQPAQGLGTYWMRLPRGVGDDPHLHTALLTYASDHFLVDQALRTVASSGDGRAVSAFSLDHALWFHRPVRFDRWHCYSQEAIAITGHRGLVRGAIHDADGTLIATAMQEVLVRTRRS